MDALRIPLPPADSGRTVVIAGLHQVTEQQWEFLMGVLSAMKPGLIKSEPEPASVLSGQPEADR